MTLTAPSIAFTMKSFLFCSIVPQFNLQFPRNPGVPSSSRLKLIDGHLRRDLDPDMEVEVEVLDVNEDEARALLLSIDPLAALAQTQE
jgi:hypothetical protein